MEQTSTFDSFEAQINPMSQSYLKTAANWAMFLSILGFIGLAFSLLGALGLLAAGGMMDSAATAGNPMAEAFSGPALGLTVLVFTIIWFFPMFFMFKFASKTKHALNTNNAGEMTKAFNGLKNYFMFMGILAILTIVFYIAWTAYAVSLAGTGMGEM